MSSTWNYIMLTFPTETSSSFKITWHETEQERKFNQRQSFFISLFISQMTFLFVSLINKTCGYKGFSLVKNLFSKYFIVSLGYNKKNKENHKTKILSNGKFSTTSTCVRSPTQSNSQYFFLLKNDENERARNEKCFLKWRLSLTLAPASSQSLARTGHSQQTLNLWMKTLNLRFKTTNKLCVFLISSH